MAAPRRVASGSGRDATRALAVGLVLLLTAACASSGYPPCTSSCDSHSECAYPIADGCHAKGVCVPLPFPVPPCPAGPAYCGCNGSLVYGQCDLPAGYAPAPVVSASMIPLGAGNACMAAGFPDGAMLVGDAESGDETDARGGGPVEAGDAGGAGAE
jgi:hypothetical protein